MKTHLLVVVAALVLSGCSSEQLATAESEAKSSALKAATFVQATAVAVQLNEATADDLAASAEQLATLVAAESPQAAADLRAAASVAKAAPGLAPQVSNVAGAIAAALK